MKKLKKIIQAIGDTFVPSSGNDNHPYIFRREAIVAVIAGILLIETVFLASEFVVFRKDNFLAAVLPGYVMSLTNSARANDNLKALSENLLLKEAAQKKANDMAKRGYFSHTGPDGKLPWQWLDLVGYNYSYAGENLAVNFTDTKELVDGWLASPAHRKNILRSNFTDIGIGMATGTYEGRETIFVVQFFGTPSKDMIDKEVAKIENKKSTSSNEIAKISADTPVVFGTSTYNSLTETPSTPNQENKDVLGAYISSPNTVLKNLFIAIVLLFLGLSIFGMSIRFQVPHPKILTGCILVIAVIVAIMLFNKNIFSSGIKLPTDTQSASVINALR